MPVRSNIFQRLIVEVHRDLGPGWNVTESRELTDADTGAMREVDVVVEAVVKGYHLLLCIEVCDRGRKADVTWLEGIAKKHDRLPMNKLVVWSDSGFSAPCLEKAKALGIEAVTPGSLEAAPWATLARDLVGSLVKYVRPVFSPAADVILENGAVARWECQRETLLTQEGGDQRIRVGAILDRIAGSQEGRTAFLDHAPEGSGDFYVIYEPPFGCTVEGPDGAIGKLTRVVIDIKTQCEIAPTSAKSVLHDGTVTTLAEATLKNDGILQFVTRETATGSPAVTATRKKPPPSRRKRSTQAPPTERV